MGNVLESRESSKNEDGKTDKRWSAHLWLNGMTTRNLLHSVMNVQFRNYLLDAEHPIADSDVCLYVLLPVFSAFQLFAQGRHEHPQRSNIVFPTAAPKK